MAQIKVGSEILDKVYLASTGAGENLEDNWQESEAAATEPGGTVLPGAIDQLMGSVGLPGQYLKRINATVSGPDSRVVRKEGLPPPKKALTTAAGSTTTVINTANNPEIVTVDQFKGHLVRIGTGPYRKILAHTNFPAGTANTYTLDQPITAPAAGVAIIIENPLFVVEVLPLNAAVGPHALLTERRTRGDGWYLSGGADVMLDPNGKFDSV